MGYRIRGPTPIARFFVCLVCFVVTSSELVGPPIEHLSKNTRRSDDCLFGVARCFSPRSEEVRHGLKHRATARTVISIRNSRWEERCTAYSRKAPDHEPQRPRVTKIKAGSSSVPSSLCGESRSGKVSGSHAGRSRGLFFANLFGRLMNWRWGRRDHRRGPIS